MDVLDRLTPRLLGSNERVDGLIDLARITGGLILLSLLFFVVPSLLFLLLVAYAPLLYIDAHCQTEYWHVAVVCAFGLLLVSSVTQRRPRGAEIVGWGYL